MDYVLFIIVFTFCRLIRSDYLFIILLILLLLLLLFLKLLLFFFFFFFINVDGTGSLLASIS